MDRAEYCINRCGAKCCTHPVHGVVCPRLGPDNRCTIYAERYRPGAPDIETVALYEYQGKQYQFQCGRIEQLLAAGHVPPHVTAGCCYAKPGLLEIGKHGSKTSRKKLAS